MSIGNQPPGGYLRADGRTPTRPAPHRDQARGPEVGRGVVHDPVRRHAGAVRGHDRGPRPAAPARQGHGLGHRHVRDAAAGDGRAQPSASRRRARSAAGRTRSSAWSGGRCAASSTCRGSGSGRSRSTATSSSADGGTRTRVDHRRLRRPRGRAHHATAWSATSSAHVAAVSRRRSSTAATLLDLDYSEDSHAEVDFNVVGTDAGAYVELQGTAEGKPFDRASLDAAARPRERRPRAAVRGAVAGPRDGPPLSGDRRVPPAAAPARRDALPAQARASCGSCSTSADDVELVSPDDVGHRGRARGDGRDVRDQRPAQGALLRPPRPACRRSPTTRASRSTRSAAARASARGATPGPDATDAENNAKLLRALGRAARPSARGARYVCVLALALPGRGRAARRARLVIVRRGTCRGRIATAPEGDGGFGYDPIFEPEPEPPGGRTLGEWSAAEKNAISHRSRAARRMAPVLRSIGFSRGPLTLSLSAPVRSPGAGSTRDRAELPDAERPEHGDEDHDPARA